MTRTMLAAIVGLLLVACGPGAPSGGTRGAATEAGAAAGSPASAPAAAAPNLRQQVIDGARAEGQVNAAIQSAWTPGGLAQIEEAIEREFGVRIRINFTPVQNYIQRYSEMSSELAAGATPSFDLNQTSDANALLMLENDLLERVNWAPLLPAGSPPEIVQADGRLAVVYTDHTGLLYDPTVIAEADVPRSIRDLGNPRWRGRFMVWQYTSSYIPWVVMLGREPTLAALRAAMQNGAVADTFVNEYTRFAAKEYPMVMNIGSYFMTAQLRGIPSAFTPLDFSSNTEHSLVIPKRAANPNAAKLLAAVLVGPEGHRIADATVGYSNRHYEGSADYRLEQAARAAGFPSFTWWESAEAKVLALSAEGLELQREIDRILKGG
jgi:ABC-type Fe3+ transport system substrate-binding protein